MGSKSLKGKAVLITGASAGMGKDMARGFLKAGARVFVAARRLEKMRDLEELGATAVRCDVTKQQDIDDLRALVLSSTPQGLDILVNNAGFSLFGAVEEVPIEKAQYQFDVNLFSMARTAQAFLPEMRSRKHGVIINIGSIAGHLSAPLGAWYHSSKFAVEGFSDCLRLELRPAGVKVVLIEPGGINTDLFLGTSAIQEMESYSSGEPYKGIARVYAKMFSSSSFGSPASVITNLVMHVAASSHPRARYARGRGAHTGLLARRMLSDRAYDAIVGGLLSRRARKALKAN